MGTWLAEGELRRVEHQSAGRGAVGDRAIEHIADDGVADVRGVDAQLVRAAGVGDHAQARAVGFEGEDGPVRKRGLAVDVVDDLVGAVVDVGAHGDVDGARVAADDAFNEGDVGLVHLAPFELAGEVALGVGVEAEDEEAGGVHVEAVDDEGAGGGGEKAGDARGDTVFVGLPFAGDGEQAGGLVDDDVARGLVNDGEQLSVQEIKGGPRRIGREVRGRTKMQTLRTGRGGAGSNRIG